MLQLINCNRKGLILKRVVLHTKDYISHSCEKSMNVSCNLVLFEVSLLTDVLVTC